MLSGGGTLEQWLSHEDGALTTGIRLCIKGAPKDFSGGPVAKTLNSKCRGHAVTKIEHPACRIEDPVQPHK